MPVVTLVAIVGACGPSIDATFEFVTPAPGDEAIVAVSRDGATATITRHVTLRMNDIYGHDGMGLGRLRC